MRMTAKEIFVLKPGDDVDYRMNNLIKGKFEIVTVCEKNNHKLKLKDCR